MAVLRSAAAIGVHAYTASGALLAWLALLPFPPIAAVDSGGLPIDRGQGDYLVAVALTTAAAALASILSARRAARVDPIEAIGQ